MGKMDFHYFTVTLHFQVKNGGTGTLTEFFFCAISILSLADHLASRLAVPTSNNE